MSPPIAAVIIPHYNDVTRLRVCLDALVPQLAAHPGVEAVVVDNNSPLDLGPLISDYPALRFIIEPAKGAAAARNRGVRETTAPTLLFVDSDCVPAPDWLATGLRLAGSADIIGGRVGTFDETPAPRSGAEAFENVFAFHQKTYVEKKGFSGSGNLLTSRAIFTDVGDFIVGLSEDVNWCRRATAKGYQLVYADDLVADHPTRQDWPALARKWKRTTEEAFHLNGTGAGDRARWLLKAGVVLASGPAHVPKLLKAASLEGGEKQRAIGTLLRLRALRARWMVGQALRGK